MATSCQNCDRRVPMNGWCAVCRVNNDEGLLKAVQHSADLVAVPEGSAAFACPRCLTVCLSAGDGCTNCGYGYEDDL
jgi:hypothetical protein